MRKLVLAVALISTVGFGLGRLTEDMCVWGGASADDPATPVTASEFALPAHSQVAPKAAIPVVALAGISDVAIRAGSSGVEPEVRTAASSSLQNPRRC